MAGKQQRGGMRARRGKQEVHGLDEDGRVVCNPRDREAAHRAQVEGIATDDPEAVTCKRCRARLLAGRGR